MLLPLYYRLKLTSIYTYLEQRFGFWSYKTGAGFFIISRVLGASLRTFLVINVLQIFVFDAWNVPFWVNVLIFISPLGSTHGCAQGRRAARPTVVI